jgi:hypothetical protein
MKKFFQKLFLTEAYMATLTEREVAIGALTKKDLYDYAYAQGRLDQIMGNGPDVVSLPPSRRTTDGTPVRYNPPPRKTRIQ